MGFRFGTWPSFNGKKVVLEDDARLLPDGTPTDVPGGCTYTIHANMQQIAFVRIKVDGTLIVDGTLVMY
jgi:hypothetical protein